MDIADNCILYIDEELRRINTKIDIKDDYDPKQTQSLIYASIGDKDKYLDLILDQQSFVKMIIERDDRVRSLRRLIDANNRAIDDLRRSCSKISLNMLQYRQSLKEDQSRELERFQLQQLKSITEDHHRHQRIYEQRLQELASLKSEYEREESGRHAFLASVQRDMERQVQRRQEATMRGDISSVLDDNRLTDQVRNSNHIELDTVDEYAPYGATSSMRRRAATTNTRGGKRGRGRRGRGKAT